MEPKKDLSPTDFKYTRTHTYRFSKNDSKRIRPGIVTEYEWKDYCPAVFRCIQEQDNINSEEYMQAFCGLDILSDISIPRKTGCVIKVTGNNRFLVKTLWKSEVKVLQEMLPNYYQHISKYKATLLVKLYGLHLLKPAGGLKVYFVVMSNVLQSDMYINKTYDLKGSPQGRTITKAGDSKVAQLKDLDLDLCFYLDPRVCNRLLAQIKYDCDFLEAEGVMDYSLLLGVHIKPSQNSHEGKSSNTDKKDMHCSLKDNKDTELKLADMCKELDRPSFRFGVRLPARAVPTSLWEIESVPSCNQVKGQECHKVLLYFGIIDIFQCYNVVKRLEHAYKSMHYNSKSIPAVNPKAYSSRFQNFLSRVFQSEESDK